MRSNGVYEIVRAAHENEEDEKVRKCVLCKRKFHYDVRLGCRTYRATGQLVETR
jgi:Domain of unknown function (DUF384)